LLGIGDYPKEGKQDPDLINAGKVIILINLGNNNNQTRCIFFFIIAIVCFD
jgi:acyl CoA:acetate/3-ketoacid CoA transferase beta subunit